MGVTLHAVNEVAFPHRRPLICSLRTAGFLGILGTGLLYFTYYLQKKFRAQQQIVETLMTQIDELKAEVAELKHLVRNSSTLIASKITPKSVGDDDEYLTADSDEEDGTREKSQISTEEALFTAVDTLLERSTEEQRRGYRMLKRNEFAKEFQDSCGFWWRLAKAAQFEATAVNSLGNKSQFQELINEGYNYAERAVLLDDDSANAHKWLAILCGSRSEFLGTNDRIQGGYKFKEHVDRAIFLDPTDSTCYYLLGRFCLEVSMLSWWERQIASALFSVPPSSTPQEAMTHFQKSETLKPLMDNRFYMAKCYSAMNNKTDAVKWLDLAASMPSTTSTDAACLQNVMEFRQKLLST